MPLAPNWICPPHSATAKGSEDTNTTETIPKIFNHPKNTCSKLEPDPKPYGPPRRQSGGAADRAGETAKKGGEEKEGERNDTRDAISPSGNSKGAAAGCLHKMKVSKAAGKQRPNGQFRSKLYSPGLGPSHTSPYIPSTRRTSETSARNTGQTTTGWRGNGREGGGGQMQRRKLTGKLRQEVFLQFAK